MPIYPGEAGMVAGLPFADEALDREMRGARPTWAVVDLGFRAFVSRPLIVGQLGAESSWEWEGWKLSDDKDVTNRSEQPEGKPPKDGEGEKNE